jgi:tRNA nucleotidyltransferase (CCA-adding enzyme)
MKCGKEFLTLQESTGPAATDDRCGQTWPVSEVLDYIRSLGLDAYLVGGAVRDELLGLPAPDQDFLVPNLGHAELRAALDPYGRVEDLEVGGRLVGVRFHPRDREARRLAPKGIELTPPRVERSTGPGRHDFEIVADASITVEEDLRRRDFTVNAMARRLETGELVDPFGGERDLRAGVLRAVSPTSFREDPLRLVRGFRFVSQLGFEPDEDTLRQMREDAAGVRLVSAERIGGGLAADGMGELSKLLLGAQPRRALRLMRDTGVLVELLPEFGPAIGRPGTPRQQATLDEHTFAVVQAAADAGFSLPVRLAAFLHDLGKPHEDEDGRPHAELGAEVASRILRRLRYPERLRAYVVRLVRGHAFHLDGEIDGPRARHFLAAHGEELARDLLDHKEADLHAKAIEPWELPALARLREAVEQERSSPYRLADLAVDGGDLISIGFSESPELGHTLATLLDEVIEDPSRNTREALLERAREALERA